VFSGFVAKLEVVGSLAQRHVATWSTSPREPFLRDSEGVAVEPTQTPAKHRGARAGGALWRDVSCAVAYWHSWQGGNT
jgi:hypothetical protein